MGAEVTGKRIDGEQYRVALTVYMEVTASNRSEAGTIAGRALGFDTSAVAHHLAPTYVANGTVNGWLCEGWVHSAEPVMSRPLEPHERPLKDWDPS